MSAPDVVLDRYLECHARNDLDGVLAQFAENAVLEDPVGDAARTGTDEIRAFYRETHRRNGPLSIERVGPVLVRGREVAVHVRAGFLEPPGSPTMDVIYTGEVDDGRFVRLRAFY